MPTEKSVFGISDQADMSLTWFSYYQLVILLDMILSCVANYKQ